MKVYGQMMGKCYHIYMQGISQYKKEILAFTTRAARTESNLTEGTFNRFVKPGDSGRLCRTIEEHIGNKCSRYTRKDYFIAAAKICGTICGIESEQPWYLKEYFSRFCL